ncbi:NADH-ubiquinone oxidoreductase chain 1 [Datura stramonium]|uniref:NADH-ubiquinone oxidoreductase chain 1 n=1 Tax=Datura stramonium TaxID=4076 RepID=A0ABS8VLJ2_DATST|nr:NADH-ubiquinone oxidoreductase chain 1 [Datura stramonium]
MSNFRSSIAQAGNISSRKHGENIRPGRRGRVSGRGSEVSGVIHDDFDTWDLDPEDLKMELQTRKQREAVLEAALADKEIVEDEYRKKVEEGKKREASLENDLANMWVLVAQLKKENSARQDLKQAADWQIGGEDNMNPEINDGDHKELIPVVSQDGDHTNAAAEILKEEPLVARLKARMQEMKEKEHKYLGNGDANSHICKVCFELPTAAMLLPCRHFCLCKSCSLACIECPICRTKIADRIFAFT